MSHVESKGREYVVGVYLLEGEGYVGWGTYMEPCILLNVSSIRSLCVFEALNSSWMSNIFLALSLAITTLSSFMFYWT